MPGSDCRKSGLKWVPVSVRFSLSERQTLARSTFLSRIATRFRHNACDTQLFLPEQPFVFLPAAQFPFLEPVHSLGSAFPALPEGQASAVFLLPPFFPPFPRYSARTDLLRPTPMLRTPFARPLFDGPSADAVPWSVRWHTVSCRFHAARGRFAYPASMFLPGAHRNVLRSCWWAVRSFQIRECRCSLFSPPFPRPFSIEVAPSFFAAKLGCRRARPVRS